VRGGASIDPRQEDREKKTSGSPDATGAFALMFDLGLRLAAPILIGVLVGAWLDGLLKTAPWLLFVGVLLGVGIAFYALYDVSRTYGNRKR
jgi:ATP synthase protein I